MISDSRFGRLAGLNADSSDATEEGVLGVLSCRDTGLEYGVAVG